MKEAIILQSIDADTVLKIRMDNVIYKAVEDKPKTRGCAECCFMCGDDNCARVPGYCADCLRTDNKNIHWVKQDES